MRYEEALDYIYSREKFGMKLGLENIKELLEKLGNPEKKFKSVHIAGTKGKGSVCAFIASILSEQGFKVGMFTSPHLVDFRERIIVGGRMIGKKHLASLVERIKPLIRKHTYFEVVTAIAFLYFAEQKVDFAVVEVGLGGRLDATNAITPEVSVITNISLDHVEHLGDTIDKIAFEKAGIIKPGVPVVVSEKGPWLSVIKKAAQKKGSIVYPAKKKRFKISLKGEFQQRNAAAAVEAVNVLRKKGIKISCGAVEKGLLSAEWPGRLEFAAENLIFDCCHNSRSAEVLASEIKRMKIKDVVLVIGIMKDKDIKSICSYLEPLAKEVVITRPEMERAAMPEDIARFIKKKKATIIMNVKDAVEYARLKAGKKGFALVTGSIFTVGSAFPAVRKGIYCQSQSINSEKSARLK